MISSAFLPHGISLSFISVMEPTIIPFKLCKQPLRFKFIIIRSTWYKYSSKSSIKRILSAQSIADSEPSKLYKIERFPPTNSPFAFPLWFKASHSKVYCNFSPNKAAHNEFLAASVALGMATGMVACNDSIPIRFKCPCKTVTSLKPIIHFGFCLNLLKSNLSIIFTVP